MLVPPKRIGPATWLVPLTLRSVAAVPEARLPSVSDSPAGSVMPPCSASVAPSATVVPKVVVPSARRGGGERAFVHQRLCVRVAPCRVRVPVPCLMRLPLTARLKEA